MNLLACLFQQLTLYIGRAFHEFACMFVPAINFDMLQVVRKSSVEMPQVAGWSRGARASPFASRLIRTAYPRPTFPGAIRGRLGLRGNARNFQWKREAADSADAGKPSQATPVTLGSQTLTPMTRSFTYTRTEPKQDVGATANI
jgi:hypothetical protein